MHLNLRMYACMALHACMANPEVDAVWRMHVGCVHAATMCERMHSIACMHSHRTNTKHVKHCMHAHTTDLKNVPFVQVHPHVTINHMVSTEALQL